MMMSAEIPPPKKYNKKNTETEMIFYLFFLLLNCNVFNITFVDCYQTIYMYKYIYKKNDD